MNKKVALSNFAVCGLLALAVCLFGMPLRASALEYYTWVDEFGVTHFSEEEPEEGRARRAQVDVPLPASRSTDPDADYYSIANQNRRMQASRREREEIQAERDLELERLKLQREQLALELYEAELRSQSSVVTGARRDPGTT